MIDPRPSQLSKRGAARVNVIWLVVLLVGFFVALALAWVSNDEAARFDKDRADAIAARQQATQRFEEALQKNIRLSEQLGWYDPQAGVADTDVEALSSALEQYRESFPNMDPTVETMEEALRRGATAYTALSRQVADLKQQLEQLQNEVQTKSTAMSELSREKDQQISDLQRQLQDATAAAEQRQQELEQQVASVRSTLSDRESELTQARADLQDQARRFAEQEQLAQTRMKEQGRKLQVFLREPEAADGTVLAVSDDLGIAWINRGQKDRVFRGMRFRVVDGSVGDDRVKGWAEVTRVQDGMSEVRLTELADRFDPPVPGDMIFNPLYDPTGERNAVLVGRFSGTYNEKELRALLDQIHISVQPRVDQTTDFLIVGSELYTDEEGEPLEDPIAPSELPVYKDAVAQGVQVVPLRDVRRFFLRATQQP